MSIIIEKLTYTYMKGTPFQKKALDDISLTINDGEFVSIIGHTGSGKSTLIQHINGLIKPTDGKVFVDGLDITEKKTKLIEIRKKVGLVFQYPEYQLFEETVEKDIAYGPSNLNISEAEISSRVKNAMEVVGLNYETFKDKSPFELSGGQKRRVAVAGVVAMEPKVLILDEPTAGLDPKGRDDLLSQIVKFKNKYNMTIILVSHSMEDVAKVSDRILVLDNGKCILDGCPSEVFKEADILESVGLAVPQITYVIKSLNKKGFNISEDIFTVEGAKNEIIKALRSTKNV